MEIGLTVGDSIDRAEATAPGFEFVEFGLAEAADVPERIDVERLRGVLDALDVDFYVHLPFEQDVATPVPEINEAIVAHQRRLLEWAGGLGARKAVLHGTLRNPHDTDLRPIAARQLAAVVEAGSDVGVEIVVENVGHQPRGLQLSVLGRLAREAGASVCFDVGHAYMEDGEDGIARFTREYGDLISHLHVHDARSRGDTHLPIGAGEIRYDELGDRLDGFDGTVAVEVFTDDVDLLRDTARRAAVALGTDWSVDGLER